ncbi:MAG: NUDIX domain-containing protein [Clostridia bacterium]|nr:NUDIX domain-containing protein [Clostridia bacterium]
MKNLEKRDLYDINGNLTEETIYKGEPVPDNRYIIVVLVFMQNSEGKFLIQKRSKEKDGKYGSTGGHAKSGENSIQAMITEIKEELGVTVNQNELELIFSGREDSAQTFFDIYYLKKDYNISDFTLQKEEVEFVKWCSIKEIKQMILDGEFLENHAEEVYRLINIFKERGIDLE